MLRFRRWLWWGLPGVVLLVTGSWLWHVRRVEHEWQQAQAAAERHDLDNALVHLDQYLKHRPNNASAWFLAGRTARRLGLYTQAEAHLTRCQEIGGVTEATRLEWDLLRVQQGDLRDIDARLRATVGPQHPDVSLVLEALARGYLNDGRLVDALQASDMWAAQEPDDAWAWLWRGRIYERLDDWDQALENYEKALQIAPEDRSVRLALGALLSERRQSAQAAEHFEYVLQRFPDDRNALLGLAGCRIEQGESAHAVPLLERVLASNPTAALALILLGKAALEQDDPDRAGEWLTKAVEQAPENIEAAHLLIRALQAQGKQAEADMVSQRLEAVSQDIERLDFLVQAIARKPEDAALRHEAGMIALRLGRPDDGVRWLLSALRCPGDHGQSHAALAEHFAQQGDPRAEFHRRLAQTP